MLSWKDYPAPPLILQSEYLDDKVIVQVNAGPSFIPFLGPDGWSWRFRLNNDLPMTLKFESGASSIDLDLTDIKVSHLKVETGASSSKIVLPAHAGKTLVEVEGGAASFDIRVPEGVAARVRVAQGASSVRVDEKRFPVTSYWHITNRPITIQRRILSRCCLKLVPGRSIFISHIDKGDYYETI